MEENQETDTIIDNGMACNCRTPGKDDGDTTCWVHHDCAHSNCTHNDYEGDE